MDNSFFLQFLFLKYHSKTLMQKNGNYLNLRKQVNKSKTEWNL